MKKCELLMWDDSKDEQVQVGVITLDNGKLSAKFKPGYAHMMKSAMTHAHWVGDKLVHPNDDKQAWFDSLPSHYDSARLRARML